MNLRLSIPAKTNKYYIRKAYGGYSSCIQGYPAYFEGSVLANCVGYATGRFNEIIGMWAYAIGGNAENFIDNCPNSLKTGTSPKQGCIMVWQRGATKSGDDGAGHVAIVEKVINPNTVFTSESGYGGTKFFNEIRQAGSAWGKGASYTFLGCIYNPAVTDSTTLLEDWQKAAKECGYYTGNVDNDFGSYSLKALKKISLKKGGTDKALITWLQYALYMYGYYAGAIDGIFGAYTYEAVTRYQKQHGLYVDGIAGYNTCKSILYV